MAHLPLGRRQGARLLVLPHRGLRRQGFGFVIFPADHDYRGEDRERMGITDRDDDIADELGVPDNNMDRKSRDDDEPLPW